MKVRSHHLCRLEWNNVNHIASVKVIVLVFMFCESRSNFVLACVGMRELELSFYYLKLLQKFYWMVIIPSAILLVCVYVGCEALCTVVGYWLCCLCVMSFVRVLLGFGVRI